MRILVADDDPLGRTILSRSLERWGCEVAVAHDGEQAWRIIQEDDRLAIAILDWVMPAPDGPELCRRVRQDDTRAHLHVILLTARDGRANMISGLQAGADDYLTKPFDPEELHARVNVALRIVGLQQRLSERVDELETALARVKQLRGLLPICSYCKRIRTDQDYWEQLESYISDHSDARFSHGICPQCYEKALAETKQYLLCREPKV